MPKINDFDCEICGKHCRSSAARFCSRKCMGIWSGKHLSSKEIIEKRAKSNRGKTTPWRKTTIKPSAFSGIVTGEMAYWIGFLMADGYVFDDGSRYAVKLCLQGKDIELVRGFRDFVGSDAKILIDKLGRANVAIWCRDIVKDLERYGIVTRKTGMESFPSLGPTLTWAFIRGYFDGDGCVSVDPKYGYRKIRICSASRAFLEDMWDFILAQTGVVGGWYVNPSGTCHYLTYTGIENVSKISKEMYGDCGPSLERKKTKFDNAFAVSPRPTKNFIEGCEW